MSVLEHEVTLIGSRPGRCSEKVSVGAKTLQAWHIVLDFDTETAIYRKTAQRLRI